MKLSIIVPIYNEVDYLLPMLERVKAVDLGEIEKEIILVDDNSTDGTRRILQDLEKTYRVLYHPKNRGKGAALRTGIAVATGNLVIIQDADLEYDPEDYKIMLQTLTRENLPVLYGSRILNPENRRHSSFPAYVGGRILTMVTNLLFGTHLTDEPTCYKLFQRALLLDLNLRCERFEFCPEVTAKIAKRGIEIREVPIRYYPRTRKEGKKINWQDFFQAIETLFHERFERKPVSQTN